MTGPPTSAMIGQTISHYKIVEKLGQGGMGVVYKAEDLTLGRLVALKFLAPHLVSDEDSHKRFIREARAAATLDHPNICTVYEIGEAEGQTFIAMAYVEGNSLEQMIAQGPFKTEDVLELVLQVGAALAAAHAKGIVHRDIKPANILVAERTSGKDRQAKLVDFGLAQFAGGSKITKMDSTIGTVAYMSPEQTSGKDVDHRTDIWALGVVLYRMLTGQLPFKGHYDAAILYSILNEAPEPLSAVGSGVSPELERIVNKALAKSPAQRYQRMEDMLADLRARQRGGERQAYVAGKRSASAWTSVKTVFLEVCDLEPEIRRQRLDEICGDNQELRRQVEQWLQHDSPDSILDSPAPNAERAVGADESAAWDATAEISDPWIGRTVQSYKLLALVGQGGMGKVYRAEDIRLKRPVAVKFPSSRFLRDDRQKKRFLREAQAAAALDHPSICAVYDVGENEGYPYIVTAFIAGHNLAEAIPPGGLPAAKALEYAIQIAEGLHAAHQRGIFHRDLKPGNVILASSEAGLRAKIIDFGLSQIAGATKISEPGQVIGTAAYIAPEILRGESVDERGDIWSLGVMLYEMLAGHPPFDAENRERLFYVICHEEAEPLTAVRPNLPEDVGRIVAKALEKDRERRYQSVRDFLDDLRELKRRVSQQKSALSGPDRALATPTSLPAVRISAAPAHVVGSSKTRRWMALSAAGLAVMVGAVVGLGWLLERKDAVRPPGEVTRLTFDSALALHPAVSPDGKYLAFASDRAGEANFDIWVQSLPGGEPVRLTRDAADEDFPSFSPDGTKIAFQSERDGRDIYSVSILGGEPRLLAQNGRQPRYSPDGQRLSFTDPHSGKEALTTAVFLMPVEGGERTEVRTGLFASSNPVWSPDGSRLLYAGSTDPEADLKGFQLNGAVLGDSAWYSAPVSGGQPVRIEPSEQFASFLPGFPIPLAWLKSNQILFSYASGDAVNLWVATLSPDNRRITGSPEQLTFGAGRITDASVADSGAVVFAITATRPRLWNIPLETRETRDKDDAMAVVTNRDFTYWPSLSDTGKLTYLAQRSDKFNLLLKDLPSGKETVLANLEGDINLVSAYINRSGTQLAYTTLYESKPAIYTIGAEGGTPEKICEDCGQLRSWSPDGKIMLSQETVSEDSGTMVARINRIDVASGRKTVLLQKDLLYAPDFSPDGHWVAFQSRAASSAPGPQLFVAPMSDAGPVEPERWVAITELKHFDVNPVFSRDGKILYFNSDRDGFTCLWAVQLDLASKKPVGDPFAVKHFHGSPRHYSWFPVFTVGPDRIIISLEQVQSDLWMTKLPE